MNSSAISIYLALFLCLLQGVPTPALSQSSMLGGINSDRQVKFGLHIHRFSSTNFPELSFGAWRLWDAGVNWRNIQPSRDRWDFTRLDAIVLEAERRGIELSYVFGATPTWAAARASEAGAYGPGSASEPLNNDDWAAYVQTVTRRYKGRIKNYEVWNEPNWKNFYTGDWKTLATLVRTAARIIRLEDKGARFVSPGFASQAGLDAFNTFLDTGIGDVFDAIGFHFYTSHRPPEVLPAMVLKLRGSLASHGISGKPIWNTEFGWLVSDSGVLSNPAAVGFSGNAKVFDQKEAGSFIVRASTLLFSVGISRSYYYSWDNDEMGVYSGRSRKLKVDFYNGFRAAERWLGAATTIKCGENPGRGLYRCAVSRPQLPDFELVWSVVGALQPEDLGSKWKYFEDISGDRYNNIGSPSFILVGAGPVAVFN